MTEVSKIGEVSSANQSPQLKSQMKAEEKIKIFEGMTVNDVEQNGSEAQKIVAGAFDNSGVKPTKENNYKVGDGKYSEREAEDFNNYTFAIDKKSRELRAHNNKTGCTSIIRYNNLEELKENAALLKSAGHLEGGTVTYDFRNKITTFDGVSTNKGSMNIASRGKSDKVIIRNSDVNRVISYGFHGTVQIENTKNLGMIWDSPTMLYLEPDAQLKTDNQSNVEIKRYNNK